MNDNLKPIETLRPFTRFLCTIGELPTSYLISMTYEEQLIWFCNYLEKTVIPTINNNAEDVEELKNLVLELQHYLDNLDLQEEVNTKIDEMVENGEFDNILQNYLKIQPNILIPEYVGTRYKKQTQNYIEKDDTLPQEIEGICYIGTNKVIAFYSPIQNGITQSSNCIFEEYDITNTAPTLSRQETIANLMHANSCCYDNTNGKIYVALWGYYSSGVETPVNQIAVLDYITLSLERTLTISDINISKVAFYNNKLYALDPNNNLYEINTTNETGTLLYQITSPVGGGSQGFDIRDNKVYVNYANPCVINVYDFTNGNYINSYSINEFDNYGHALGSYSSDISFINDDTLLIGCHKGTDYIGDSGVNTSYMANYLCKINIRGRGLANPKITAFFTNNELYVNTSNPENVTYATGSNVYPLKLVGEYLNNYYKKLLEYKINGTNFTYYGTLRLINETFQLETGLTAYGLFMANAGIDGQSITINSNPINIRGSKICGSNLTLNYDGNTKHNIKYSILNVPQISSNVNIVNTNSVIVGNTPDQKIEYYNSTILSILRSSLTQGTNKVTASFSSSVSNTNFNPNNYLIFIGLSTGENIIHPIVAGLGVDRRCYDHSGNEYIVGTYTKNSKSLEISSSNSTNITVVSMITL